MKYHKLQSISFMDQSKGTVWDSQESVQLQSDWVGDTYPLESINMIAATDV